MIINKIKYYIYSRKYKNIYSSKGIKNITNANYVYLGRQNGKTIMSFKWNYIRAVERHDFKSAKMLKKLIKRYIVKISFKKQISILHNENM